MKQFWYKLIWFYLFLFLGQYPVYRLYVIIRQSETVSCRCDCFFLGATQHASMFAALGSNPVPRCRSGWTNLSYTPAHIRFY